MSITELLKRPVSYHPALARLTGSVPAAVLLSQAIYWQDRVPKSRPRGCPGKDWWYHSIQEWEQETALTRDAQKRARECLVQMGILQVKRAGLPARLWFRVDSEALENLLINQLNAGTPKSKIRQQRGPDGRFIGHKSTGKPPAITESTTETTTEITTTTTPPPTLPTSEVKAPDGGSGNEARENEYVRLASLDYCSRLNLGPEKLAGTANSIRKRLKSQGGMSEEDLQQFVALKAQALQAQRDRQATQAALDLHRPTTANENAAIWLQAREKIRSSLDQDIFSLWIEPLSSQMDREDNILELICPDRLYCSWVADNFLQEIKAAVRTAGGGGVRLTTG